MMLFNCSLLTTGLCNLTSSPHEAKGDTLESYEYSKWRITNCSPAQTQSMITILDQMQESLPSVIEAVHMSTASAPYRLFFKSTRELPLIQEVFANIAAGEQVRAASDSHILRHAPPEFICTTTSGFTASYHKWCTDSHFDAVTFNDMEYVIICPSFWTDLYPSQEPDVDMPTCPNIGNETTLPEDEWMLGSKLAIVIHELVHLYTVNQIAPEIYLLRSCSELSAAKAAHNANNYTFFAMSILLNCTDWPAGLKRSLDSEDASITDDDDSNMRTRSHDRVAVDRSRLLPTLRNSGQRKPLMGGRLRALGSLESRRQ